MSTTVLRPPNRNRPQSRRRRAIATIAALLLTGGFALAALPWRGEPSPSERATSTPARVPPGPLTAAERAAVVAALGSRDATVRRRAVYVAEGRAGALALADPAILHHYGVDTSAAAQPNPGSQAAERFHHR